MTIRSREQQWREIFHLPVSTLMVTQDYIKRQKFPEELHLRFENVTVSS